MKKKYYYILGIIILLLAISSCGKNDSRDVILEKNLEKVSEVKYSQVEEAITKNLEEIMEDKEYYAANNIRFVQDELAIDDENEVKKFNNIKMKFGIEVNSERSPIEIEEGMTPEKMEKNFNKFMEEMNEELLEKLHKENPIEYGKIGEFIIINKDSKHSLEYNFNEINSKDSETMKSLRNESSKEEKEAIERLFEFMDGDRDVYELTRFGSEENVLVIEFNLYKEIGGKDIRELAKMSNEVHNLAVKDNKFQAYIEEKNIRSIRLNFDRGEGRDEIIYEYEVG